MLIPIYSQMKTSRNFTKKAYRAFQVIVLCTSMCLPCAYHVFAMCLCVSAFIDYSCIYAIHHKKLTYAVNVTYHTTMGTGMLQVRVRTLCRPFCSDCNRSKMVVYFRQDDSACLWDLEQVRIALRVRNWHFVWIWLDKWGTLDTVWTYHDYRYWCTIVRVQAYYDYIYEWVHGSKTLTLWDIPYAWVIACIFSNLGSR